MVRAVRHQKDKKQAARVFKEDLIVRKPVVFYPAEKYQSYEEYAANILEQIYKALEERPELYRKLNFQRDRDIASIPAAIMLIRKKMRGMADGNFDSSDPTTVFKYARLLRGHFDDTKWIAVLLYHMNLISHGETLKLSDYQIEGMLLG